MSEELLKVENLRVQFGAFPALSDVTFDLMPGETLGLVGESGSGKSTLARAILRLLPITSGQVHFQGENLLSLRAAALRRCRRDLQIVFQDPLASLNPRMSVADALAEPLKIYEPALPARARESRIAEMLERVGLAADVARRYPHEFSGGQCQRIGIARAMMLRPKLLICDEPVSSLDVSIQGQIVNLLADLQRELGTAMLFISHNLAVVRHLSHRVLVIYRGRLVELAGCDALFAAPAHPYTRALLAAVPHPSGTPPDQVLTTSEDPGTAPANSGGCAFHARCAHARPACLLGVPSLEEVAARHFAACHRRREVVYP
jgi:oligopeptide/dipeptide ABC transporter ATP-binding protein